MKFIFLELLKAEYKPTVKDWFDLMALMATFIGAILLENLWV